MVSGLAAQATFPRPLRPIRLPISASVRRSGSDRHSRAGRHPRRIRFSAARYSCWRSSSWFTSPVTYQTYVFIPPIEGGGDTYPQSINEAGVVAGSWSENDGLGPFRGFVRDARRGARRACRPASTTKERSWAWAFCGHRGERLLY